MKRILPIIFGLIVLYNFGKQLSEGRIYYVITSYFLIGFLFLTGVYLGLKDKQMNFNIGLKIIICWLPAIFSKRLLIWCWK